MSSRVWSALGQLDSNLQVIQSKIERLRAGLEADKDQLLPGALMDACGHAAQVRDLIYAERPDAEWTDRESLELLIVDLEVAARERQNQRRRARLLALADELESGSVRHRFANRTAELNGLRLEAVSQLRAQAVQPEQEKDLPGPEARQWLHWACNLDEKDNVSELAQLASDFHALDLFTAEMEEQYWVPAAHLEDRTPVPDKPSSASFHAQGAPTTNAPGAKPAVADSDHLPEAHRSGEPSSDLLEATVPIFGDLARAERHASPWLVAAGVGVLCASLAGVYHFHGGSDARNTAVTVAGIPSASSTQGSHSGAQETSSATSIPAQDSQQPKTADQQAAAKPEGGLAAALLHKQAAEGMQDNIGLSVESCGRVSSQSIECWGYLSNLREKDSRISLYRVNVVDGNGNSFDLSGGGQAAFASHDFKVPAQSRVRYSVKVPDNDPEARTLTLYVDVNNPRNVEYTFRDVPITE